MKPLHACMIDPHIFGGTFAGPTFDAWRFTGRTEPPRAPFREGYLIKPRRAAGTLFAAAVALHAALQDYRDRLGPGEFATVALIASDRRQARQALNYVKGLIADSGVIKAEVANETAETITFAHRVQLEVHTTSFRSTRGYRASCADNARLAMLIELRLLLTARTGSDSPPYQIDGTSGIGAAYRHSALLPTAPVA
jgi:hypothetical protein